MRSCPKGGGGMDAGNTASMQGFIPNVQAPGLQRSWGWDCNLITHHLTSDQIPTPLLKGKSTLRGSQTQRIQRVGALQTSKSPCRVPVPPWLTVLANEVWVARGTPGNWTREAGTRLELRSKYSRKLCRVPAGPDVEPRPTGRLMQARPLHLILRLPLDEGSGSRLACSGCTQ